jgi:hypothetical protein
MQGLGLLPSVRIRAEHEKIQLEPRLRNWEGERRYFFSISMAAQESAAFRGIS